MRSKWKHRKLEKPIILYFLKKKNKKSFFSHRSTIIDKCFKGLSFKTYNGIKFTTLKITEKHFGYKFGELMFTKQTPMYKKKK